MTEQVGNASPEVSESNDTSVQDAVMNPSADNFFEELDRSVNGGILEEPSQTTSEISDNTQTSQVEVQPQSDEIGTLQKRYSDSSREAQRLNGKLSELEPYMPILDAMREDPNLITHVRNYFEGGGQTPQTMVEKLNLDEDFTFEELLEKSPNAKTFPQIFVDGELVGGFNEFEKMEWWADRQ